MGDWFVGQKVVCVATRAQWRVRGLSMWWRDLRGRVPRPVEGRAYHIARFGVSGPTGCEYLALEGFPRRTIYQADGFRPLVEAANDIGALRALLTPAARVTAD